MNFFYADVFIQSWVLTHHRPVRPYIVAVRDSQEMTDDTSLLSLKNDQTLYELTGLELTEKW